MEGDWNKFLGQLDYGFTCIFAIEVMLKVIINITKLMEVKPQIQITTDFFFRFSIMDLSCIQDRILEKCGIAWI